MRNRFIFLSGCCACALGAPAFPGAAQVSGGFGVVIAESGNRASYRIDTNIFAIDVDAAVDLSGADVRRAKLGPPARRDGCYRNPPLRLIVEGAELFLRNGSYALRVRGESARVVIGIVAYRVGTESHLASDVQDELAYLVLDEIVLNKGGKASPLGQSRQIVELGYAADTFELAPRESDFSACLDDARPVSPQTAALVREKGSVALAWVTGIALEPQPQPVFRNPGGPELDFATVERAIGSGTLNTVLAGSDVAVAAVAAVSVGPDGASKPDEEWRGVYTLAANTWDACTPIDRSRLKCSNGMSLRIDDLVPRRFTTPMFWGQQNKLVYVTVKSEPSDANIFIGGARHTAKTDTSMDMPARQIPYLRLEKMGYPSCPYGPRWRVDAVDGPRPTMTGFCALAP